MERTDNAPIEYIEMVYRREFGYTPSEMDDIPAAIILRDLRFMSTESRAQKNKQ